MIFCFSGHIGSGKTSLARAFADLNSIQYISTGDFLRFFAREKNVEASRLVLQEINNNLVNRGWNTYCHLLFEYYETNTNIDVSLDSIRSIESLNAIKNYLKNDRVIHIHCDVNEDAAISRQSQRGDNVIYNKKSKEINDYKDIDLLKVTADYVLDCNQALEIVINQMQKIYLSLKR